MESIKVYLELGKAVSAMVQVNAELFGLLSGIALMMTDDAVRGRLEDRIGCLLELNGVEEMGRVLEELCLTE